MDNEYVGVAKKALETLTEALDDLIVEVEIAEESKQDEIDTLAYENKKMADFLVEEGFDIDTVVFDNPKHKTHNKKPSDIFTLLHRKIDEMSAMFKESKDDESDD